MSVKKERHFSNYFDYLVRRLISSIFYYRIFRKIYPHTPWYTPGAIKTTEKMLTPHSKVFEWGSGASSIWYAERVGEYIGIEDNERWYTDISKRLNSSNTRIVLCDNKDEYINAINKFPDRYFDCISIDGRHRIDCLKHAVSKLSDNGLIVFDDSQRPKYQAKDQIMSGWTATFYDFGIIQTAIYKKAMPA